MPAQVRLRFCRQRIMGSHLLLAYALFAAVAIPRVDGAAAAETSSAATAKPTATNRSYPGILKLELFGALFGDAHPLSDGQRKAKVYSALAQFNAGIQDKKSLAWALKIAYDMPVETWEQLR